MHNIDNTTQPKGEKPMEYIEVDGHRRAVVEWIQEGFQLAEPSRASLERQIAGDLLSGLLSQASQGRGLMQAGGGDSNDGRSTLFVVGSVDLIALARSVMRRLADGQ